MRRLTVFKSCQLWLPVSFDPTTEVAKMLHVEAWNPWQP